MVIEKIIIGMILWGSVSYFFYKVITPLMIVKMLRKRNPGIENQTIIQFLNSYYIPVPKKLIK